MCIRDSSSRTAPPEPKTQRVTHFHDSFSTNSNNPRKMADIKALGDQLVGLTVKEVSELAQYLKDEYKIEPAAAAVAMVAGAAAGGGEAAAAQTAFDVILKHGGQNKLAVVKLSLIHI